MSRVRSGKSSADIQKVAGLAAVAVVCFTLRALLVLCTDVPVLNIWHPRHAVHSQSPLLIFLYYFIEKKTGKCIEMVVHAPYVLRLWDELASLIWIMSESFITGCGQQHQLTGCKFSDESFIGSEHLVKAKEDPQASRSIEAQTRTHVFPSEDFSPSCEEGELEVNSVMSAAK
eukprot:Gb_22379 [translate_table: standard]